MNESGGGNVWLPKVGSADDKRGERLVKRGLLKHRLDGGYIILRQR